MLQAAFSNHLISLSFYRSFVKFSQLPVVALSVTTKYWSNPTRPGLLIFLRLHRYIFTSLRAVFRYVITALKLKKKAQGKLFPVQDGLEYLERRI